MIWKTCCAFHNMFLKIDGLDKPWDGAHVQSSQYAGRFGDLEFDDMPLALQRLYSPSEIRAYDTSATAVAAANARRPLGVQGEDVNRGKTGDDFIDGDVHVVRDLSLNYFRGRLVEHFDILFHTPNMGVMWPRSRGKPPRTI